LPTVIPIPAIDTTNATGESLIRRTKSIAVSASSDIAFSGIDEFARLRLLQIRLKLTIRRAVEFVTVRSG
jgi:hypothetical protein